MKRDSLAQRIKMIEQHLQTLQRRAGALPEQQTLAAEILEELSATLKELSAAAEELPQHNAELELRVKERAAELAGSNQALQNEIAECNRMEQALHESEERYRTLVESAPEAIAVHQEGKWVYVNPMEVELLGAAHPSEIVGKPVMDFVHPDDQDIVRKQIQLVEEKQQQTPLRDLRMVRLDGQVIDVEAMATATTYQGKPAIQVIIRDITDRRWAEEEHKQLLAENLNQRQFLERLMEAAPIGIAVVRGSDHRYEFANLYYRSIPGTPSVPMVGRTIAEVFPDVVAKEALSWVEAVYRTGQIVSIREYEASAGPGQEQTFWNVDHVPLLSSGGAVNGVLIIASEVTEQVKIRRWVEELAARDQAILTSLIEGLVIFDLEGNVLSMNPVALHIHGFSQVEEAQKRLSEYPATFTLHYLDGRPMPVEEWPVTRVLRGETFSSLEVQVWHMDTGRAWIASYGGAPVCDKTGNMILGVLTLRNITAQKEAELQREQLLARVEQEWQRAEKLALEAQQRAAELDATIAAIADGVVIYEPTGKIARMNPAAEKILGYSPAERELPLDAQVVLARIESMDGRPFADIKDTPDQRVLRGEAACNAVMAVRDIQSGQRIWVSARAAPIQAPDGRLLGVVASYTDITELRRARDELELRVQERTVELTKANEALQQYALRLSILREIDRAILAAQSPSEIALTALGYVCKLVPCQRASVILFDFETGEAILLAATANGSHRAGPDQRIRLDAVIGIAELRQGHPFVVEDIQALTEHSSASELLLAQTTHSYISVPLISRSQLIGSLNLEAASPGTLDVGHLEIANELVGPLAVVIQDARLYEAERQARQTAEALREATAALASTLDLQQILDDTLAYLERVIPYDSACVFLHEGTSLRAAAVRGHPHWQEVIGSEYRVEDDLLYQEIRSSGSPVILADAQADPRFKRWDGADDVRSWMGVPLIARGKIVGMLTLDCRQVTGFVQAEATLAQAFANQAAVAIENARLFEQVRTGREQLRLLARQVVSVQEQERRRVSRELHDEAGQALTALKISLELVMADLPSGAELLHERIRESVILTDDTMERIRLLARDLRPPALDAVGLSPTLEDVCRDFGGRTHLSINYEGEKLPVLPDAVSICLYRVLQEALTNVAKHAQAQHVWAALRRETDSISLSVEDDGQGFDTQATLSFTGRPMGIGLLGIQDRLELLSGWLEIDSQPGKGTRLVAHVPWEETE